MTVSFAELSLTDYQAWVDEHYDLGTHTVRGIDCRRCGMHVWAVEKHAVNVHGDDFAARPAYQGGKTLLGFISDDEGRMVDPPTCPHCGKPIAG